MPLGGIAERAASVSYPHLCLREWPFRVVPEPQFCDFLADRSTLKTDVESLLNSLTQLGVSARLAGAEQCSTILADLFALLTSSTGSGAVSSNPRGRTIWIVDELQRAEDLAPSVQRSILSGLVGVFNRCPTG